MAPSHRSVSVLVIVGVLLVVGAAASPALAKSHSCGMSATYDTGTHSWKLTATCSIVWSQPATGLKVTNCNALSLSLTVDDTSIVDNGGGAVWTGSVTAKDGSGNLLETDSEALDRSLSSSTFTMSPHDGWQDIYDFVSRNSGMATFEFSLSIPFVYDNMASSHPLTFGMNCTSNTYMSFTESHSRDN